VACGFAVFPLLWALSTAFKPESEVLSAAAPWLPSHGTLANFRSVITTTEIPRQILNSVGVSFVAIMLALAVSIPGAFVTARYQFRGVRLVMVVILMTTMIPGIAILTPLFYISVRLSLYNTYAVMVIVYAGWQVPMMLWILRGFVKTIPSDLDEAARVDGCGTRRLVVSIILPLMRPGIVAASLVAFVNIWNDFLLSSTLIASDRLRTVTVGLFNFMSAYGIEWGPLMAAVMLSLIPVVILFSWMQKYLVSGLTSGAVKG
jgi:ABC-type glycerol-3-phosphate transport system permease component